MSSLKWLERRVMREDMKLFFGSAFGVFVGSNGLGDNAESIDS